MNRLARIRDKPSTVRAPTLKEAPPMLDLLEQIAEKQPRRMVEVSLDAWREHVRPAIEAEAGDPLTKIAAEWLDHFGDSNPDGWEPEQADGCWPYACECGFVELVHRSRLALGRPCCGEPTHALLPEKPEVEP